MQHPLLGSANERRLLLGNEAIVRGALEAGINMITCYPGTPSSEVPDTFRAIGEEQGRFRLEYSVNEKVAVEVGVGAALGGAMAMTTMKHVGVNVAADPLFTAAYVGLPGGFVLLSADDPFCHSSQNEQDNRQYARFMGMPCFEPASAQEAKDMTRDALLLARKLAQPVMLRTTTRVNHLRGPVDFGPLPEQTAEIVPFAKNPGRFVPVPAVSRQRHHALVENLNKAAEASEQSPWNRVHGQGRLGVVASGISRAYLADALTEHDLTDSVAVFELGMSWPLPEKSLLTFISGLDALLVLEEGEPLLEEELRSLAQKNGLSLNIQGKGQHLTVFGEYSTSTVAAALADLTGKSIALPPAEKPEPLAIRPPGLCPGCAHRSVYYAVRKVFGDEAVYSSDIGCYTLGMGAPHKMADFLFCMGSSVSAGSGFAAASGQTVVAFIGDSTFFHSGISGLANAVFNQHNILLVILDNGTTAMTGHQPNPGMRGDLLGDACAHLDIEAIVRACGVEQLAKVKAYNIKATIKALGEMKNATGVRVLIAEDPCVLFARRMLKQPRKITARIAEQNPEVNLCLDELACPAFVRQDGLVSVDATLCSGCMVCLQISPSIKTVART